MASIRCFEVHTCPLWQNPDGTLTIGMHEVRENPVVVGWVNVGVYEISGVRYELLLVL